MSETSSKLLPEVLRDIVDRIVEVAHPTRLILFGSAARGQMRRDSDVDVLVIVPGPAHRRKLAGRVYRNLHGVGVPVDVVVVTEDDVANFGDRVGSIIYPAVRNGVVIYEE